MDMKLSMRVMWHEHCAKREEERNDLKKCSIVIDDLYDIERIISVLQDMRNEIIRNTGWQKLK